TVNPLAMPTLVRIQPPPPILVTGLCRQADARRARDKDDKKTGRLKSSNQLRGCSSMVEQQPSKLMTRVRFPSPAPAFAALQLGSDKEIRKGGVVADEPKRLL